MQTKNAADSRRPRIDRSEMKDTAQWLPSLEGQLAEGERVNAWLGGEFMDKPKSMRTGILAATDRRLVFFRKKMLGTEFLDLGPLTTVASAEVGVFGNLLLNGSGLDELRLHLVDDSMVRMTLIQHGDPNALCGVLGVGLQSKSGTAES